MDEGEVVETALALWAKRSLDPPLWVLDRVMARFERYDLDFAFEADQLHLPHPFAELIRLAFAPQFVPDNFPLNPINTTGNDAADELQSEARYAEWHKAIMCFADRYGLWLPFEQGEDEDTNLM